MVRSFDASTERFLNDLARTSRRIETAQREITSGKRLNSVSDDPNQISSLFESRALVERTSQLKIDLGSFKTEVDISE
ncbi:MAG TPA: hypothetical protein VE621_22970, partial [Bryobacteraceae bacterium]|nr:hypothetical protein [Bryobacteraceae bacterium]